MTLRPWILSMAVLSVAGPPLALPPGPINVAHRGASGHAPEHTFASWDLALSMGADYMEQDLQMTADGVLVVLHDETLDRTARGPASDCRGPVRERTLAQIRRCDVGTWFNQRYPDRARAEYVGARIPTLEEVVERYGRDARYYIETKRPEDAPGMEEALLELLARHGLTELAAADGRVLIQSFSEASLRRIHALDPRLPLVRLLGSEPAEVMAALVDAADYAVGIGPSERAVDAGVAQAAKSRGLVVHPYTVNETARMRRLLDLGVDGMFTDFPDRLAQVLASRGP